MIYSLRHAYPEEIAGNKRACNQLQSSWADIYPAPMLQNSKTNHSLVQLKPLIWLCGEREKKVQSVNRKTQAANRKSMRRKATDGRAGGKLPSARSDHARDLQGS